MTTSGRTAAPNARTEHLASARRCSDISAHRRLSDKLRSASPDGGTRRSSRTWTFQSNGDPKQRDGGQVEEPDTEAR